MKTVPGLKNKPACRIGCFFLSVLAALAWCVVPAAAQEKPRAVKTIEVRNNLTVGDQTIFSKIKLKPGKEFQAETLSDDIKRLYATGLFRDVSADVEDYEGGVKVIFHVDEKPVTEKIILRGSRRLKTKRLTAAMKLKEKEIFDNFKLKEDLNEMKKLYAEKGYPLARLEPDIEERENRVTVTINIDEGNRIRVHRIEFSGNDSYERRRLLKLLKTKKRGLFQSGFFREETLEEDKERITAFYHGEGFIDAAVNAQTFLDEQKSRMHVLFSISEGRQYRLRNIEISGNTVAGVEVLKKDMSLTAAGEVFTEQKLRSDITALQSFYFDRGYIAASVKVDTVLDPESGSVDVFYALSEGHVAYVDKINIEGNSRSKDVVIRREIRLFPGDRYNGEKLKRSRERLNNLGYFEEISFDTPDKPTTLPDKYDLDVFVREAKTGEFSFGAGYSSVDKFIGFIDLTQKNFDIFNWPSFVGAGQRMRVRTEFGTEKRDYELSFVEPWFWGYPLAAGFDIYNRTREWSKYTERRIGGNVFLGKSLGEYWYARVIYRYEGVRIYNIYDNTSRHIKDEEGKNFISSVTLDLRDDTRDSTFNPTRGMFNKYAYELAGGPFRGDKNFMRYTTENRKYIPLSGRAVCELKARLGLVEAFSDSQTVPVYERFYAGGAYTIRGYQERGVGPHDEFGDPIGGRFSAIANIECAFEAANNFKWAFFYDIGNIWQSLGDFKWNDLKLRAGIGTGIRVKTPLGPIKLDYGYALDPIEGESRGRFHFTMSHDF